VNGRLAVEVAAEGVTIPEIVIIVVVVVVLIPAKAGHGLRAAIQGMPTQRHVLKRI
jgi:hypothetical protein